MDVVCVSFPLFEYPNSETHNVSHAEERGSINLPMLKTWFEAVAQDKREAKREVDGELGQ
jgi:hypothetical protein